MSVNPGLTAPWEGCRPEWLPCSITTTRDADTVFGEAGDDVMIGGAGSDILNGGLGDDTVRGQGGADDTAIGGGGIDIVVP